MNSLFSRLDLSKWVLGSWIALFATSIIFIPTQISKNYFDSLAFPHIIFLTLSAFAFTGILFFKKGFQYLGFSESISISLLIVSCTISVLKSGNPISSLTGDTQRFTGAISLFALLTILIYHSNITIDKTKSLIIGICSIATLVTVLGALQQWKLITLPGAGGAGSTLGNIDFLSAWIGTTIPLFLFLLTKNNLRKNGLVIAELLLSVYLLIALDVKQGWVDLILATIFGLIYLVRYRIKALNLSKKTIYWAFGLVGFLWVELVLLVPFQKTKVPLIGTDPNVQIRTQYWLTGLKIFFRRLYFGVGPDNYGNYYQQYRTLTSVLREENITSNDAHSALFQTISTLGLFGSLAFLFIFIILARAIWINFYRYPNQRKLIFFSVAFFVIYSTNAIISPITLPHKFIFWAMVGLMFGLAYTPSEFNLDKFKIILRPLVSVSVLVSVVVITLFSIAQVNLIRGINGLENNFKSPRVQNYQHSSMLPCTYYYLTEQTLASQKSTEKVIKFAEAEVKTNPRCIDARLTLAKYYFATGDSVHIGPAIRTLMEMAPANREVLGLVGQIATKLGDRSLLLAIHNQEVKLGFLK